MRAIAGAIVILAGSILAGSATLASTTAGGAAALAGLIGGILVFLGLCLLLFGWDRADRLPKSEPPDRPSNARP